MTNKKDEVSKIDSKPIVEKKYDADKLAKIVARTRETGTMTVNFEMRSRMPSKISKELARRIKDTGNESA
jgi:hypothetical protein